MIGISALVFDSAGAVVLHHAKVRDLQTVRRRATKTAVLDGDGVRINDRGAFDDQDLEVEWSDDGTRSAVQEMVRIHGEVRVCTSAGVFRACPAGYEEDGRTSKLRLLVIRKETT
jgi:hypothetical protein